MKKFLLLIFFLFIGNSHFVYATDYEKNIYTKIENGKCYYANVWGDHLTDAIYTTIFDAYTSYVYTDFAIVERNGLYGIINLAGIEVVPCKYELLDPVYYETLSCEKLMFVAKDKDYYGIINFNGECVIPFIYKDVQVLYEKGVVIFKTKEGKYEAINVYMGKTIIPSTIYDFLDFKDFYADYPKKSMRFVLAKKNSKWGFLDYKGKVVIPFIYKIIYNLRNGYIVAQSETNNLWYIYDAYCNKVLLGEYDDVESLGCGDGMICVKKNNRYGFADIKTGKLVLPCIYDGVKDAFHNGIAKVFSKTMGTYMLISKNGRKICNDTEYPTYVYEDYIITGYPKRGILDKNGNIVTPFIYDFIRELSSNGYMLCQKAGKSEIIDVNNNIIIPLEYDGILVPDDGDEKMIPVWKGGKCGYIDYSNKVIIPFIFDRAEPFMKGANIAYVEQNGKCGYIDRTGKFVTELCDRIEREWAFDNYMVSKAPSDVDENIPVSIENNKKTFVLIMSNENYLEEDIPDVNFSISDGKSFKEYCTRTLGIPLRNIKYLQNATLNQMRSGINWICDNAIAFDGEASIIVYYSGHGMPNEKNGNAYLLPADGSFKDYRTAIGIDDTYKQLGEISTKQTTIFLDACFSGTSKDGKTTWADSKGITVKAKPTQPQGNMIVFAAAQGDETAHLYKKKKHSMFTYFLLKKLKETKGEVSLGDLGTYINKQVRKNSVVENGKIQSPTVSVSNNMSLIWSNLKLK